MCSLRNDVHLSRPQWVKNSDEIQYANSWSGQCVTYIQLSASWTIILFLKKCCGTDIAVWVPHASANTLEPKVLRSTSITHRFDTFVSGQWLIFVNPRVFTIMIHVFESFLCRSRRVPRWIYPWVWPARRHLAVHRPAEHQPQDERHPEELRAYLGGNLHIERK